MNIDTSVGQILRDLELLSKRLFGRKCRLPVAALAAADDSPIWARQVARTLGIGENQAASELAEFERLGALQLVPSSFDRRKVYQRINHHFWSFVRETVNDAVLARGPTNPDSFWDSLSAMSDAERSSEGG
jgi:hypothetical protein